MSHAESIEALVNKIEREKSKPKRGDGIGRDAIKFFSSVLYKPKGWTEPRIVTPYPEEMPPKSTLWKMEDASYEPAEKAPKEIDGWELIKTTTTLKFYKKDDIIIVAIRGTADKKDLKADFQIAFNALHTSKRYLEDVKIMNEVFKEYSKQGVKFYAVAHSLGGAIADLFIKAGFVRKAVSYNPAVEKPALESDKNYRIYMVNDPLFNTMGKYSKIGEVRSQKGVSKFDSVASVQSLKAHLMTNFKGGKLMGGMPPKRKPFEDIEMNKRHHLDEDEEEEEEEDEEEENQDEGENDYNDELRDRIAEMREEYIRQQVRHLVGQENNITQEQVIELVDDEIRQAGFYVNTPDTARLIAFGKWLYNRLSKGRKKRIEKMLGEDGETVLWGKGILSNLKDKVTHIFGKSSKYNNISTKTLKEYGGMKIKELVATREKIQKALNFAMNLVSSGNFGKETQKLGFDDLYHIRLFAKMENGTLLLIEKNEVIYIKPTDKIKGEALPINYKDGSLTLQKLMDAGEKFLGKNFYLYDAFTNNCASFVVGVLKGNKLWSDADTQFLAQDVSSLKAQLPKTSAVSNFITSLGAIVSRIQGKGKRKGKYSSMEDDVF